VKKRPKRVYMLTFEALPDAIPEVIRLRRFLKSMLRGYGFRCLKLVAADTNADTAMKGPGQKLTIRVETNCL
jgi:hypothetical protein